jgi:hypothetical protein
MPMRILALTNNYLKPSIFIAFIEFFARFGCVEQVEKCGSESVKTD